MENVRIERFGTDSNSYMFYRYLLVLTWGQFFLFHYVSVFLTRIPFITLVSGWIVPICFVFCAVLALPYIMSKTEKNDILFLLCFSAVFMFNLIFLPENESYLQERAADLFLVIIPLYYVGLCFDTDRELDLLYIVSVLNILSQLAYVLLFGEAMTEVQSMYEGNMDVAYKILPHVCLAVVYAFKKVSILRVLLAVSAFVYLVSCGSRGPVLMALLFIMVYILFVKKYKIKKSAYAFIAIACAAAFLFYESILKLLEKISVKMGMSIRIFDKLANDMFWYSSGRNEIAVKLFKTIGENPFFGYGMGADYSIVGIYAHNLAIELWVSYGVFLGTALLLLAVTVLWKGIKKSNNEDEKAFIILLTASCFIKLFLSGTYLNETFLMFLFGICMGVIRKSVIQ